MPAVNPAVFDPDHLVATAQRAAVPCAWWSLRVMRESAEALSVRSGVVEPPRLSEDLGAMVTVVDAGGMGYAATADLSVSGLRLAFQRALGMAQAFAKRPLWRVDPAELPEPHGDYQGPELLPWRNVPRRDKLAQLLAWDASLRGPGDRIVDSQAQLTVMAVETLLATSHGGRSVQRYDVVYPGLVAYASDGKDTQRRSFVEGARQAGAELLTDLRMDQHAQRLGVEAIRVVEAPNCPSGKRTLILAPDQMMLQIHESIGHPLELDRILGDERNFAGTSFVTPEMFGSYRYGSDLLNITFDPSVAGQLASYAVDDEGTTARRTHIIEKGMLLRPLGGAISQTRAALPGVANARACGWNRPPIDRMANLNLESGTQSEDELIQGVEKGVRMATNLSWSIDDSRNKFQFGCEVGELIEEGQLKGWVKNPCYRGISATFWRNLSGVAHVRSVFGTPFCGKGEPSQIIRVGHASPTCRFENVDIFGGEG